jgi:ribosome-associated toxin RatA of RatAB toxin-antitoxin module
VVLTSGAASWARGDSEPADEAHGVADMTIAAAVGDVSVRVTRSEEGIEVEGRCLVDAPPTTVWAVLTDYDGIDRFVSSMRESHVSERSEDHVLVDQVAVGRLFLFSRRLRTRLLVREEPLVRIVFEDVLKRDFALYQGDWRIQSRDGGTEVVYRAVARPARAVPDMMLRGMFKSTVRDLLSQVRVEIERRAELLSAGS